MTASLLVNLVANGMSVTKVVEAYPDMEPDDIGQALPYVAWLVDG